MSKLARQLFKELAVLSKLPTYDHFTQAMKSNMYDGKSI